MMKILWIMIFLSLFINAEKIPDMVTDRPDQTESSVTVSQGWLQIETGSIFEKDAPANLTNLTYNTTLLRYGVFDNTELRLGGNLLQEKYEQETTIDNAGLSPISIGFKTRLTDEKGLLPELAFLGHLTLPWLGKDEFTPDYVAPDFRFAGTKTLREDIALGFNLGGEWSGSTPQTHFFYSIVIGAGLNQQISFFAELYGYINEQAKPDHRFDTGLTLLLNPAMQLDFSAGLGINEYAPDYFLSGGFSYRCEVFNK